MVEALAGAPSPHRECREAPPAFAGVVTLVHSVRLDGPRPFCSGCGSPLDGPEVDGQLRDEWEA